MPAADTRKLTDTLSDVDHVVFFTDYNSHKNNDLVKVRYDGVIYVRCCSGWRVPSQSSEGIKTPRSLSISVVSKSVYIETHR